MMQEEKVEIIVLFIIIIFFMFNAIYSEYGCIYSETGYYGSKENISIYNIHEHLQHNEKAFQELLSSINKTNTNKVVLVGTPKSTIYLDGSGFVGYDENNDFILDLAEKYPDKVVAFPTIYPKDPAKLKKLIDLINRNASGIKLYSGHTVFYDYPLDAEDMYPLYQYLEENAIPLLWHVNSGKRDMREEFEQVLQDFPNLTVICPHFCVSSVKTKRLKHFFDTYPNFYTDISFGFYVKEGLDRISRSPNRYKKLIKEYPDRFLFATDMVITNHHGKKEPFITNLTQCYIDMLEKKRYSCEISSNIEGTCWKGLNLNKDILKKIYQENPEKILMTS